MGRATGKSRAKTRRANGVGKGSALRESLTAVQDGALPLHLSGIIGSARSAWAMEAAVTAGRSCILWVRPGVDAAETALLDLRYFREHPSPLAANAEAMPRVSHFPALSAVPTDRDPVPARTAHDRLDFLLALAEQEQAATPFLGVTSINALLQRLQPPSNLRDARLRLAVGEVLPPESLVGMLVDAGFERAPMVEWPGEFSLRGGILDIFPFAAENPWRLEFFGDTIDSIRAFEIGLQTSYESRDACTVHLLRDPGSFHAVEGGRIPAAVTLLDYLPADALLIVDEPEAFFQRADLVRKSWPQRLAFRSVGTAWDALTARPHVQLHEFATGREGIHEPVHAMTDRWGILDEALLEVERLCGVCTDVRILCRSDAEVHRLEETFRVKEFAPDACDGTLHISRGDIDAGFHDEAAGFACILLSELLSKQRLRRGIADAAAHTEAIHDFLDLGEGDLVVHVTHGIARYRGLTHLQENGVQGDFMTLEFADGRYYHLPVASLSLVQRYVGAKGFQPELSKFGGRRWSQKKDAVEEAVLEMASEYLELQAKRAARPGIAFPANDGMQIEFDASFPYEETPDQTTVSREIAEDMATVQPMDRLLCGDVGFGKTELAMRAAARAVIGGHQVAVLVPTTVLAQQHFQSFSERFAAFPMSIDVVSRYRKGSEIKDIRDRLATGRLDILIGTHRLLSHDIRFDKLGLVIVDEEQRFGVQHKDALKRLRESVDVLTLTATPIPRTLHMALLGIRDISSLTTPPVDRLAVRTEVALTNEPLIRDAILREKGRGGQVFFVHNRVMDIDVIANRLRKLVPEVSVGVAHGQMTERQIRSAMNAFTHHRTDVLVATTIIESGLDIPNANTLIVNRADRFGLADLHQLRGRVGRYKHRAYAYFLLDPDKVPSDIARRRLRAIAEFSQLGAGFQIAMKDLEIRGAGNILGEEQSGHIAAVGYDLYCKLLQKAIARLKDEEPDLPFEGVDVGMRLGIDLHIPPSYISDSRQRLEAYRRLFDARTLADLEREMETLRDRYGPPPDDVTLLYRVGRIRLAAAHLRISNIRLKPGEGLHCKVTDFKRVQNSLTPLRDRLAVLDNETLFIRLEPKEEAPARLVALLSNWLLPERPTAVIETSRRG